MTVAGEQPRQRNKIGAVARDLRARDEATNAIRATARVNYNTPAFIIAAINDRR